MSHITGRRSYRYTRPEMRKALSRPEVVLVCVFSLLLLSLVIFGISDMVTGHYWECPG